MAKEAFMLKEVKWNDRFNLGVDVIDRAHQRLFSIVGRMLSLNEDSAKQRHAGKASSILKAIL